MASSQDRWQTPIPERPSPSNNSHKMQDHHIPKGISRFFATEDSQPTPYLGLRARLSQTWINRWTILLLLVLVRTLFAVASLNYDLHHAKKEALSACTSVENVGSAMASMPYYLSTGINELTAKSIEKAISGLMEMLILTITSVEEIVLFIINMMTSTYVCLITLAVGGSLHVAIDVAADVGNFLNSTVKDVGKDLGDAASGFQDAMNGFMKDLDDIGSILSGKDLQPPTIDLTSEISKLNSLQLPSDYYQGLGQLNSSIPTFAQVHNLTNTIIELPFEEVKKLLNASLPKYTMDASLFPVPAKKHLTFCSDNNGIEKFFDDLVKIAYMVREIFLIVIIICAVLAMAPMAYRELRAWRSMKKRALIVKSDAFDPMDAVYIASRPYTAYAGLKVAEKFQSSRRKALVRWAIAYATTVPALFVLSLALAGLLGCLCQYILLKAIEREVPVLENEVIGFADNVINSLNDASEQWAIGTNHLINDTNAKINADVFGWVNTTTTAVNQTLNTFVDDMVDALNATFGGTILYDPILDVLNCLVLLKVQGIENGLTWVKDHAHIDFPIIANNTFSLGTIAKVSGSETDILNTGPNGGAADAITAAIDDVIDFAISAVRQEAIISSCLLLIWVFIALIGIIRAVVLMYKGGDVEGDVYHLRDIHTASTAPPPPVEAVKEKDTKDGASGFTQPENVAYVPSYEQATRESQHYEPGHNEANTYNGQSYTLAPRPMPALQLNTSANSLHPTRAAPQQGDGKVGNVNGQAVDAAIHRPTHLRASSHGDLDVTSPAVGPAAAKMEDPFADPR